MTDESVIETRQIPPNKLKAGWELLKLTFTEWTNDNAFELSAALAFYTIFSIAPVLLIAVGVASFFLAPETATTRIVDEMQKLVGAQGANAVRQVIESSRGFGKGLWAVSVGIVTLIMGATAVFGELQSALNQIWDVKAKPDRGMIMSFVVDRVRSFSIAIGVGFLLLVSLVISALISWLQNYMNTWLPGIPWVWQMANVVSSFFVIAILRAARSAPFQYAMYAGLMSLMVSGLLRGIETFSRVRAWNDPDQVWVTLLGLVNWSAISAVARCLVGKDLETVLWADLSRSLFFSRGSALVL